MPRPTRSSTQSSSDPSDENSPTAPRRAVSRSRANTQDSPKESKRERTKDGCLTCRMRRKKCETQRTEDGSCTTCYRLRIRCYGFAAKRPSWMKDTDLVNSKLQEITAHLLANGLVRGVAKTGKSRAVAPTTSPPPPPLPPPPQRPASPAIASSRSSPVSTKKSLPTQSSKQVATIAPPTSPLRHPEPERDNPHYASSRRSPVLLHATTSHRPIIPTPIVKLPQSSQAHDDSDSPDETSPQTPPGGPSFSPFIHCPNAAAPSMMPNVADLTGMLSDEHNPTAVCDPLHMAFMDPNTMEPLASLMSDVFPLVSTTSYPMSVANPTFGPIVPPGPYVPEAVVAPTAAGAAGQENGYYQEMQNTLALARGMMPNLAGPFPQSWQTPFDTWLSYVPLVSPRIRSLTPLPPYMRPQEDGFMYYFDHVATMQYIFDASSTDTMHHHIQENPTGVVATAIKMIAAVHDSQNRKASGLDAGGALRTSGTPEHLYRETYGQIMTTLKRSNGKLTEAEATAALHMISYWLFQGGDGKWADALKIAVHWFQNVDDLYTKKGPQVIRAMTAQQRFAAKTTMWMDIFSSITQLRIPYLNGLYNHLLENSTGSNDLFGTTNGCCDAVMCSLAAIVTLETEMCRSSDMLALMDPHSRQMELTMYIHRAAAIRERLLTIDSTPRISEVTSPYLVDDPFAPSTGISDTPSSLETSSIFRHAALLYLSTIINGPSPDIPETREQVVATHAALIALPPSSVDRSLVFPLCLAGCMTDDPLLRNYFSDRLRAMDGPVGNSGKTLALMKEVWRRRDNLQIGVAWRDVMRETKLELLLV